MKSTLSIAIAVLLLSCISCKSSNDQIIYLGQAYSNGQCEDILPLSPEVEQEIALDATGQYYKGLCELKIGNPRQAIADFNLADTLGISPKYGIWLNLAAAHSLLQENDKALRYLEIVKNKGYRNHTLLDRPAYDNLRSDIRFLSIQRDMAPSYNIWTSLFLFVALQGFFISISFFVIRQGPIDSSNLLATLLLFFSITIMSFTLYWSGYNYQYPYLNYYYHLLPYLAGPLFYLYIRNNVRSTYLTQKDLVHFIPLLVFTLLLSPWVLSNYMSITLTPLHWVGIIAGNPYSKVIVLAFYSYMSYKLVTRAKMRDQNIKTWLSYLVSAFIGYSLTMLIYYILVNFSFYNNTWDYAISFSISFFIFLVSFVGYLQPRIYSGESIEDIISVKKYKNTGLTTKAERSLKEKILHLMEEEQIFKDGNLRLDDLADQVGGTRHNVSMVINKHFKESFFDFLNRYRVEYVKEKLFDNYYHNHTIIELAYESGFNNKVSFNKAFKKFTGQTPSAYRKKSNTLTLKESTTVS